MAIRKMIAANGKGSAGSMRDSSEWIRNLQAGGSIQADALTELHSILVRGLRRSFSGRAAADDGFLEDIAQESAIRILNKLETFEGRSRFTTWAMAIAIRQALSELRRKYWKDVSLEAAADSGTLRPEVALDPTPDPHRTAERRELLEALREQIERKLTERQRLAIQAELAGMPLEEIARRLDSNLNAVYKLLYDARRRLRTGLEAAGYSLEDVAMVFA